LIIKAIDNNDDDFIQIQLINYNFINDKLIEYYKNKKYDIFNNICQHCNNKISNYIINLDDKLIILNKIKEQILSTTSRHDNYKILEVYDKDIINNNWINFENMINNFIYDIVIDGANLGFSDTKDNELNVKLIINTITNIIDITGYKILLILNQRHFKKFNKFKFDDIYINNIKLYYTPFNVNDDLYWFYAGLIRMTPIITNDQIRDHSYMIGYQNEIRQWMNIYQIKLDEITKINNTLNDGIYINEHIHIICDNKCICFN
jgi:proteinaceous RNase P